jgi:hypothetical protein
VERGLAAASIPPFAFIIESIPYDLKARVRKCTTAAAVWTAFEQEYGTKSYIDELRIEAQLYDFKKSAKDTIEEHVTKFHDLVSAAMAQQSIDNIYNDQKVNSLFIRTLEYSNIPNEDWTTFKSMLGATWATLTTLQLYSAAKTFYLQSIERKIVRSTPSLTTSELTDDIKALVTSAQSNQRNDYRGNNRNNQGNRNNSNRRNQGNQGNQDNQGNNMFRRYPRDPNQYCQYCKISGHIIDDCRNKLRDENCERELEKVVGKRYVSYENPKSTIKNPKLEKYEN